MHTYEVVVYDTQGDGKDYEGIINPLKRTAHAVSLQNGDGEILIIPVRSG